MARHVLAWAAVTATLLCACASPPTGEVIGTPRPGSKFERLRLGMSMSEVLNIMEREPNLSRSYEPARQGIQLRSRGDTLRTQVLYNGQGCLVFTEGDPEGPPGGALLFITHDASGACYRL